MRVLLIGDVHLADRPPSIRTDSYADDILAKLQFAVATANERRVDAIVQAGDIFHTKQANRTSHGLVVRTAEVFAESHAPVYIVPGNHDLQNDRLESIPTQPLGSLVMMPNIFLLMGWSGHDIPLYGVPYQQDWKNLPNALADWRSVAAVDGGGFYGLVVTHAPIFPPASSVIYEFIDADDWAEQMRVGACYYGHIHDPHGAYLAMPGDSLVEFCNNGALSRGSLHEATLKRKPTITLYDDSDEAREANNGSDFTAIEVPHRPVAEVFRLAAKIDADAKVQQLDEFLSSLANTSLEAVSVEAILAHVKSLKVGYGTIQEIEECLEVGMHNG